MEIIFLTSGDDQNVKLWDLEGNPLATLSGHINLTKMWFSKNDDFIITVSDKKIRQWPMKKKAATVYDSNQQAEILSLKYLNNED